MARIVTIYDTNHKYGFNLVDMSYIRWVKISEALARLGHEVDIATNEYDSAGKEPRTLPLEIDHNLRRVPISKVNFNSYDVVKTLFHKGFETLQTYGGADHPFIISKLGTVVGPTDMHGIYFYNTRREQLYSTQSKLNETSKYITVISEPAFSLWKECHGSTDKLLIVPGAADSVVPAPSNDPYPKEYNARCIFAGNVYDKASQPEANRALINKLNRLGKHLSKRGIRLFVIGRGDVSRLDNKYISYMGAVSYDKSWDYFHFAHVGISILEGEFRHNNESTKLYYYLRVGLPVVSESGFPNDNIVVDSNLGFVVENDNMELMSQKIEEAIDCKWDRENAISYILENHTWDKRVEVYDKIIRNSQ